MGLTDSQPLWCLEFTLPRGPVGISRTHQRGLFFVLWGLAQRLVLFIDYQNAYRRARSVFFPNPQSGRDGHLKPTDLNQSQGEIRRDMG